MGRTFWALVKEVVPEPPPFRPDAGANFLDQRVCGTLALLTFYWETVNEFSKFPDREACFFFIFLAT